MAGSVSAPSGTKPLREEVQGLGPWPGVQGDSVPLALLPASFPRTAPRGVVS